MAVPKRKTSKSKKMMRKNSHKRPFASAHVCKECGESRESHRVCPSCGYYGGRQVLTVDTEE